MSTPGQHTAHPGWSCFQCGSPLEVGSVNLAYMENSFPVNLPKCPRCGLVYVSEELATGKMAEVEKMLEDK